MNLAHGPATMFSLPVNAGGTVRGSPMAREGVSVGTLLISN